MAGLGGLLEFEGTNLFELTDYAVTQRPEIADDMGDGVFSAATTLETRHELFRVHSEVESRPAVIDVSVIERDGVPHSLESVAFRFDGNVGESLQASDLKIRSKSNRGIAIDSLMATMSWDLVTRTATWDLSAVEMGYDAYTLELDGNDVFDEHNNKLDGGDGVNGDSFRFDFGKPIAGDIDLDGIVAFADFIVLSENFGSTDAKWRDGDMDGDGAVSFIDFLMLSNSYGSSINEPPSDS